MLASSASADPSSEVSLSLDPNDPLGLLTEDYIPQPSSYPPLVGSHPTMSSSRPRSSRRPVETSDSDVSPLDLNLGHAQRSSQGGPSSQSQAGSSRPRARRPSSSPKSRRATPSSRTHANTNGRPASSRASGSRNPGLRIELPSLPRPLRAEDLQSNAVTSDSASYQSNNANLLRNRARRHNQLINTNQIAAALDPLRNTLAGDAHQVGYGYGFEGHSMMRNHEEARSDHFPQPASYFDDIMFEIRSASPIYVRDPTVLITRPDVYNSMSPFDGVDADFSQCHSQELALQVAHAVASSTSASPLSQPISYDSMDISESS